VHIPSVQWKLHNVAPMLNLCFINNITNYYVCDISQLFLTRSLRDDALRRHFYRFPCADDALRRHLYIYFQLFLILSALRFNLFFFASVVQYILLYMCVQSVSQFLYFYDYDKILLFHVILALLYQLFACGRL